MYLPIDLPVSITSGFYRADGAYHGGLDMAVPVGSVVRAVNSGTIRYSGLDQYGGAFIDIIHSDDSMTRYLHLNRTDFDVVGATVNAGDQIGLSGGAPGIWGAGLSTGPHLHFEIWDKAPNMGGKQLDPEPYIDAWKYYNQSDVAPAATSPQAEVNFKDAIIANLDGDPNFYPQRRDVFVNGDAAYFAQEYKWAWGSQTSANQIISEQLTTINSKQTELNKANEMITELVSQINQKDNKIKELIANKDVPIPVTVIKQPEPITPPSPSAVAPLDSQKWSWHKFFVGFSKSGLLQGTVGVAFSPVLIAFIDYLSGYLNQQYSSSSVSYVSLALPLITATLLAIKNLLKN
jgi:Peptidase family M23